MSIFLPTTEFHNHHIMFPDKPVSDVFEEQLRKVFWGQKGSRIGQEERRRLHFYPGGTNCGGASPKAYFPTNLFP